MLQLDDTPDDIHRLIFDAYTHERSPANILTVSRRWHAILLSMRSLWSKITIHIDSYQTIPKILLGAQRYDSVQDNSAPFLAYLQRSLSLEASSQVPLDISIMWYPIDEKELRAIAVLEGSLNHPCYDWSIIRNQTMDLVACLARPLAASSSRTRENTLNRCRSLKVDMGKLAPRIFEPANYARYPVVTFGSSCHMTGDDFTNLKTLMLHGVGLDLKVNIPALSCLDVQDAELTPIPHLNFVHSLTLIRQEANFDLDPEDINIDWEQCLCLRTLKISCIPEFTPPLSHSLPHLTAIVLTEPYVESDVLNMLGTIFNEERPLKILALAEISMEGYVELLEAASDIAVEQLMLSSRNFSGRTRRPTWEWNEFGTVKWRVSDQEMWAVGQVDYLCGKRRIKHRGMDAQIVSLFRKYEMDEYGSYISQEVDNNDWLKLLEM